MRTSLLALALLFLGCSAPHRVGFGENPEALVTAGRAGVFISGRDSTLPLHLYAIGTGILVSVSGRIIVLTAGDQFTVTDTKQTIVRHLSEFWINLGKWDGTSKPIPASLAFADEANGFIALDAPLLNSESTLLSEFSLNPVPLSHWLPIAECQTGDSVLCVGRSMTDGDGFGSYSVTQGVSIAGCVPDRSVFFLSGFLPDYGGSGSGVFVALSTERGVEPYLIGLVRDIDEQTRMTLIERHAHLSEPQPMQIDINGQCVGTSMDVIVPALISYCSSSK